MSRRSLSLQRRCAWWLNECLRVGWEKSQLPALEKLFWKYKPWNAKKMAKRGPAMAVEIGKLFWKYKPWNAKKMAKRGPAMAVEIGRIAEVQERERAAATTQH